MSIDLATARTIPTGAWTADALHSSVGFSVKHMIVSTFRGGFSSFDARLVSDEAGRVALAGAVRSASIDTRDPNLTGHILSEEFLSADQNPEITFEATEVRRDGERVEFVGQLTIKGITHPLSATGTIADPVDDPFGGVRLGLGLEATIDRRAYEMNWNTALPGGGLALGNDLTLSVQLELTKDAE
jgi:polyisoprenoid-binding protein YceI